MKSKILVTGADGQLGRSLRDIAAEYPAWEFLFTDLLQLDITNETSVREYMEQHKPAWVVNAAAYTNVELVEKNPEPGHLLNATAPGILARESDQVGASIVHISTDYVFDGYGHKFLTEESPTNPLSVYGRTKLEGEKLVEAGNPRHFIIRTSWLYSKFGNNFVKTIYGKGCAGGKVDVVNDQWGSPTSAEDLARAVMVVITSAAGCADPCPLYGIYNYSDEGTTCWADFAQVIMDFAGLDCMVRGIPSSEYSSVVHRPAFSVLDKSKFRRTFKINIPEWEDSLENVLADLARNADCVDGCN